MSSERAPRRGCLLIVSSPSGAGKTSLCRRLMAEHPDLTLSISVTTRAPRPGEAHGREYFFVSESEINQMRRDEALLEWAEVHDHYYGTPRAAVEAALASGKDVLFDIDWQGAREIYSKMPDDTVRVFILPPSIAELRRRLYARAQDHDDVIERRVRRAKAEISHWREYDYVLVNDDFDRSFIELEHIYRAERLKLARSQWAAPLIDGLLSEKV